MMRYYDDKKIYKYKNILKKKDVDFMLHDDFMLHVCTHTQRMNGKKCTWVFVMFLFSKLVSKSCEKVNAKTRTLCYFFFLEMSVYNDLYTSRQLTVALHRRQHRCDIPLPRTSLRCHSMVGCFDNTSR